MTTKSQAQGNPTEENQTARADYGIDAPGTVKALAGSGAAILLLSVSVPPLHPFVVTGLSFLVTASAMVWGSRIGKLRKRDQVISAFPWRGDEQVLDVGCGRGLLLLAAAKKLTTGQAIGLDLWQNRDQSGNDPAATTANAEAEGVARRVRLETGDARQMPFPDGAFDVVLSSWALHNIYDRAGRGQALAEIARVLRPGGRLVLLDIRHTAQYAAFFREQGFAQVNRRGPNFLFVTPTFTVEAMKRKDRPVNG